MAGDSLDTHLETIVPQVASLSNVDCVQITQQLLVYITADLLTKLLVTEVCKMFSVSTTCHCMTIGS
jgi:hypothetical protein